MSLAQTAEVVQHLRAHLPGFEWEILLFSTTGDADRKTPIDEAPQDFFTDTLEAALLEGTIDLAVHSAKDLPEPGSEGLAIAALTPSLDRRDAFVSTNGARLSEMPPGAVIGASCARRHEGIRRINPAVRTAPIRGNVDERVQMVLDGKFDGVVTAACALKRLGMEHLASEVFPLDVFPTHPLQGSLALQVRADADELAAVIRDVWSGKDG